MIRKNERRIPTILGLFIMFAGLFTGLYFDGTLKQNSASAIADKEINDPEFSNISDSSFAFSFTSKSKFAISTMVSGPGIFRENYDELDLDNTARPRFNHYFVFNNLKPSSEYSVNIKGSKQNFRVKTGPPLSNMLEIPPVTGKVLMTDLRPAAGALCRIYINGISPLSGRTDSAGMFAIPLSNLRTDDLSRRPKISDSTLIKAEIFQSPFDKIDATLDLGFIKSNKPFLEMVIGNSYGLNLLTFQTQPSQDASTEILGVSSQTQSSNIIFPSFEGESTSDNRPRIKGIAYPESKVRITVESLPQKGETFVGKDSTWSWRPEKPLEPGKHTATVVYTDPTGKTETLKRVFYVLKSGESVLGDSTPSASLTPTIPSPTVQVTLTINPSPTLLPTATSIPSPTLSPQVTEAPPRPPRTGNAGYFIATSTVSVGLLIVGVRLLFFRV